MHSLNLNKVLRRSATKMNKKKEYQKVNQKIILLSSKLSVKWYIGSSGTGESFEQARSRIKIKRDAFFIIYLLESIIYSKIIPIKKGS